MESLRKTYILRVWNAAPAERVAGIPPEGRSDGQPQITPGEETGSKERFLCSVQPIASDEIHYFSSIEETIRFVRNNTIVFRSKPG